MFSSWKTSVQQTRIFVHFLERNPCKSLTKSSLRRCFVLILSQIFEPLNNFAVGAAVKFVLPKTMRHSNPIRESEHSIAFRLPSNFRILYIVHIWIFLKSPRKKIHLVFGFLLQKWTCGMLEWTEIDFVSRHIK